jgi:hypothetical protein
MLPLSVKRCDLHSAVIARDTNASRSLFYIIFKDILIIQVTINYRHSSDFPQRSKDPITRLAISPYTRLEKLHNALVRYRG